MTLKTLTLAVGAMLLASTHGSFAQTKVFSAFTDLDITEESGGYTAYTSGTVGYTDWKFDYCWYETRNGCLQVGSSSQEASGYFITPEINVSGNISVTLFAKGYVDDFNIRLTICYKDGTNNSKVYSLTKGKWIRIPATFFPNTGEKIKLKLEGLNKTFFEVGQINVYDIGNSYYYDGFNDMKGSHPDGSSFERPSSLIISADELGHYYSSAMSYIFEGNECIYLNNSKSYFKTTEPTYSTDNTFILSFKAASISSGKRIHLSRINGNETTALTPITVPENRWTESEIVMTNFNSSEIIMMENKESGNDGDIFIDEVKISPVPTITLNQAADNETAIDSRLNKMANVSLQRTLTADIWNTMCLPFDISEAILEEAFGSDADPEVRTLASVTSDGVFTFTRNTSTVEAGTPFLVKVKQTVTNPSFEEVIISSGSAKTIPENGQWYIAGTYSPIALSTDGTNLFLGTDGFLYKPAEGKNTMNGLRAYFIVPNGAGDAHVLFSDNESDAITTATVEQTETMNGVWNLLGQKMMSKQTLRPGFYIINGRKTLIR